MNIEMAKGYILPTPDLSESKSIFVKTGEIGIRSGDWDKVYNDIRASDLYLTIEKIIVGTPFDDSPVMLRSRVTPSKGLSDSIDSAAQDSYITRQQDITDLYHILRSKEGLPHEARTTCFDSFDTISLAIGRNGEALVFDGMLPYALAVLLGIREIPVTVVVRHAEWIPTRDAIRNTIGTFSYHPISHPELSDIRSQWTERRLRMILADIRKEPILTILDIGAHYGFFAGEFALHGYRCTAIEKNQRNCDILLSLRALGGRSFAVICGDILEQPTIEYDCILALNVFHHFLKAKETFKQFKQMLKRIRSQIMYLQTHNPNDKQMHYAYRNYNPDDFCRFIVKYSCYTSFELIGEERSRRIYKFK